MALDLSQEIIQATTPSQVVNFDKNTPTTGGVVFTPDTPATTDVLYVSSTNASTWIYNGSTYVTYTAPAQTSTTPFYLMGTTIDAQGNKTAAIERSGNIKLLSGGFIGNGSGLTNLNASNLSTGTVPTARLGSGTANSNTVLKGNNTWGVVNSYDPTTNLIAYVDRSYGNDYTAVINDITKPYQTIQAAVNAAQFGSVSTVNRGLVYVQRGTYSEYVQLVNLVDIYCEPGVLFTSGGFKDLVSTGKDVRILGYASWNNTTTAEQSISMQSDINLYIEFDYCISDCLLYANKSATIRAFGRWANCFGGNGFAVSIRDTANVDLTMSEYIKSPAYSTFFFRSSTTSYYSGTSNIKAKFIEITTGLNNNTDEGVIMTNALNGANINIDADIKWSGSYVSNGRKSAVAVVSIASNIKIKGNITAASGHCLSITYGNTGANIEFQGRLNSSRYPIWTSKSGATNNNTTLIVRDTKIIGLNNVIGSGVKSYFINCQIYNNDSAANNSPVFWTDTNTNGDTSALYMYNCQGYADGTTSNFVSNGGATGVSLGFVNTVSKNALGTGTDSFVPSGFIQIPNLKIPQV